MSKVIRPAAVIQWLDCFQWCYGFARTERGSLEKISVLASGGLDSSLLIAKLAAGAEVYPIYVRCGFAWEEIELEYLESFLVALKNPNVKPVTMLSAPTPVLY